MPVLQRCWLKCIDCGREYEASERIYFCPSCGGLLDVEYEYDRRLSLTPWSKSFRERPLGVWRYRELLPIEELDKVVTMNEGGTRLIRCGNLERDLGIREIYVKYEGDNPTGSFKDRGMTVGVTKALEVGAKTTICASTGNTRSSLAAYSAKAGLDCVVLVPSHKIALGKLSQALIHGAKVLAVKGGFDDCLSLVKEISKDPRFYLLNSINPFRLEGQKTAAYEIYEQLGDVPDKLIIPVGNAGNIVAYWKGFRELKLLGLTEKIPNMIGVQALGASPVYKAFIEGSDKIKPMESVETVATAIRIGNPVNWKRALRAARETGGMIGAVTDEEILWAQSILASREGVFAEPAGAAPIAFLIKAAREGLIEPDSRVVCIVTGHGLKDPDVVLRRIEKPVEVEPEVDSVLENLSATITEQT
ncbi:MAG: threonine synthase [Thaumarchaeota archaeon]|nr:MAG: threonine synthase [Nitrososphaerota archaeon]